MNQIESTEKVKNKRERSEMDAFFVADDEYRERCLEIRNTEKNGVEMRGVFAKEMIPARTVLCPYVGKIIPEIERNQMLLPLSREERMMHTTYDMLHPHDDTLLIVPVDSTGKISREFEGYHSLYVNEASDSPPNSFFGNADQYIDGSPEGFPSDTEIVIVTCADVPAGQELTCYYGSFYVRDWDLKWSVHPPVMDRPTKRKQKRPRKMIPTQETHVVRQGYHGSDSNGDRARSRRKENGREFV
jgi:SET domain-containing protein